MYNIYMLGEIFTILIFLMVIYCLFISPMFLYSKVNRSKYEVDYETYKVPLKIDKLDDTIGYRF